MLLQTPQNKSTPPTKRPEAAGHAAALIVTRELLRGQPPIATTMRFHVDNTAVVRGAAAQTHRGPQSTLTPEWDLMKDPRPQTTDPHTHSHHLGQFTPG
jgi:hypothetical protein